MYKTTKEEDLFEQFEKQSHLFLNRKRLLGRGGYSKVYQATNQKKTVDYAVKIITIDSKRESKENMRYKTQLALHDCKYSCLARHNSLIHSFCSYTLNKYSYAIVMSKACGNLKMIISNFYKKELFGKLNSKKIIYNNRINNSLVKFFLNQIINSMYFFYENDWVHFDIKPENLLLINQELKLSDFSLVDLIPKIGKYELTTSGTFSYMPPEYYTKNKEIKAIDTDKIDVFGIGCVLYKLITNLDVIKKEIKNNNPTENDIIQQIHSSIHNFTNLFGNKKHFCNDDEEMFQLICKMLHFNINKRMSLKNLLEDKWRFKNYQKINQIKEIHVNDYIKIIYEIQKKDLVQNIQRKRKRFNI